MPVPADSNRPEGPNANESESPKDRREFLRVTTRSSMSLLLAVPAGAAGASLLTRGAGDGSSASGSTGAADAASEPVAPPPPHEPPPAAMDDLDRLHAEFLDDNEDVVPYSTDASPTPPAPESDNHE